MNIHRESQLPRAFVVVGHEGVIRSAGSGLLDGVLTRFWSLNLVQQRQNYMGRESGLGTLTERNEPNEYHYD